MRFLCAHQELVAQNLLLRRQLGLFLERKKRPRRVNKATQLVLVLLSRLCDWKDALVVIKPEIQTRWHRQGFRPLWRGRVGPGDRRFRTRLAGSSRKWKGRILDHIMPMTPALAGLCTLQSSQVESTQRILENQLAHGRIRLPRVYVAGSERVWRSPDVPGRHFYGA